MPQDCDLLWDGLPRDYGSLWNGTRGGLIVPSGKIEPQGLSSKAYIEKWTAVGADSLRIVNGPYYAYEYCGYYGFSDKSDDQDMKSELKEKVRFLMEDMPALRIAFPHRSPVVETNLHGEYEDSKAINVSELKPLALAGNNLSRTPVFIAKFGPGEGSLVVSQLLTQGRMSPEYAPHTGSHPREYDEVAVQFVLNMIKASIAK